DSVQLGVQFREGFSRNVAEPTRGVQTLSDLRQRSFGDVQEIQTGSAMPPRESFNDVCRHRVGGLPDLAASLEALKRGKLFDRQLMELDEQVVGALPGDERVMSQRHVSKTWASTHMPGPATGPPPHPSP